MIKKMMSIFLVLLLLVGCQQVVAPEFELTTQVATSEKEEIDYKTLEEKSEVIVKVKVLDAVSLTNSTFNSVKDYYSLRKLEVISVYKNTTKEKLDSKASVLLKETSANDGRYIYYVDNHIPLVKDVEYVLYLVAKKGYYELVHYDDAVLSFKYLTNNVNYETFVNFALKYLKPKVNGQLIKENSAVSIDVDMAKTLKYKSAFVEVDKIKIPIEIGYNGELDKRVLKIQNHYFVLGLQE